MDQTMMPENGRIGEILESSTTQFLAASYELFVAPPFGALVRVTTREPDMLVYGLVYDIYTGSRNLGGRAIVRGRMYSGKYLYDHEIYREHPDLAEVLQTEFAVLTVGFARAKRIFQYLPPQPPPVHYSVYPCLPAEQVAFSEQLSFLRLVLQASNLPSDELVAAAVRGFAAARRDGPAYLVRAGRELARLLSDDYDRLIAILKRIQH